MTNLSIDVCRKIAAARREKGLTQSALAGKVGCKQSAISMFEAGLATKLSDETVAKIAKFLGVDISASSESPAMTVSVPANLPVHGFCPSCHCPSNVPYVVEDRLFFRPVRSLSSPTGGARCAQCGEVLETRCPACGAPLNDGACCAVCGTPYVTPALPPGTDLAAYALARRAELTALRALT